MSVITTIDGIPLYSTPGEALAYAASNNLVGFHTHVYQGQAATSSSGFNPNNQTNTPPGTSSGGFSGGGSGGY